MKYSSTKKVSAALDVSRQRASIILRKFGWTRHSKSGARSKTTIYSKE